MVYQILISTMYLHFSIFFLVFMIVGLVGEAVVIAQDFRPLIPPLFLSPDNTYRQPGSRIRTSQRDYTGSINAGSLEVPTTRSRMGLGA